ncbi:MAG: DNA polymerase III subunit alpha [Bacilli bacterium]|nr:DNA polymerase III subunit alpha [Bacilli bacterium]
MAPIYVKTVYSFLSSLITVDDLINLANANNYQSLCICDDNMFGSMEFITKCNSNNINPIVGVDFEHYLLFCKNYHGYVNLMKLVTLKSEKEIDYSDLEVYHDDLVLVYQEESDINKLFKDKFSFQELSIYPIKCLNKEDLEILNYLELLRDNKTISDEIEFDKNVCYQIDNNEYKEFFSLFNLSLEDKGLSLPDFSKYNDTKGLNDDEYLYNLCVNGLKRRFNNKVTVKYKDRLLYELDVIKKMGFSNYFLVVYDFILYAKKNNILVGPGRGSACGSLVSYSLGITDVDPLKYDLLFERFLNNERVTMPDIDTDFPDNKRDLVIDYCRNKYGNNQVASIITFDTFGVKSSLRDMGRVLNVPLYTVDELCKLIGNHEDSLTKLYEENDKIYLMINSDLKLKKLYEVAKRIIDIPRHSSIHAAGIVMANTNLTDIIPLVYNGEGYISSYEAKYLESLGLLKMDFLGIRNLTIIDDCINLINDLKFSDIPMNDKKTYQLFQDGDTRGIFQFESAGMQNFLRRLKPVTFSDIYNANAFYRPGPSDMIPEFLERRNGKKFEYISSDLEPILSETKGIIVYQEQIMLIASIMANFSLGKADILRRAISKKKIDLINSMRDDFINGSINNHYSMEVANKVFDDIVKFASYGFNKSHSVAYSVVSYKMAYLKANYPKEFYISILNNSVNDKKIVDYISEMKKKKINLLKPDINLSSDIWYIKNNKIIMPMTIIKGISNLVVKKILANKKDKFNDIYDFFMKTDFDRKVYISIIDSGLLDSFNYNHRTLYENLDNLLNYSKLCVSLGPDYVLKPEMEIKEEFDNMELINKEKDCFGFYLTNHPVRFYKDQDNNIIDLIDIKKYFNKTVDTIIMIDKITKIKTKNGDDMAFITGSDEEGSLEFVVFPKAYQDIENINRNDIVKINGKVERKNDYQIIVNSCIKLKINN